MIHTQGTSNIHSEMHQGYSRKEYLKVTLRIPSAEERRSGKVPSAVENAMAYDTLYNFLRELLRRLLKQIEQAPNDTSIGVPCLRKKGPRNSLQDLRSQLDAYWQGDYPFRVQCSVDNPLEWWRERAKHESADILGVSILSDRPSIVILNTRAMTSC